MDYWIFLLGDFLEILLASVIIPFFILHLISRFIGKNFLTRRLILTFLGSLFLLSIAGVFIWNIFVQNKVFHEWDTISPGYLLIAHEVPADVVKPFFEDGQGSRSQYDGSWLAPGWSLFSLHMIWLGITIAIYLVSFFVVYKINKKDFSNKKQFIQFLRTSFFSFLVFSVLIGVLNQLVLFGTFLVSNAPIYLIAQLVELFNQSLPTSRL
jgi:hypothetical protein